MTRIFGLHVPFTAYERPAAPPEAPASASPQRGASPNCDYPEDDDSSPVAVSIETQSQQQQQAPVDPAPSSSLSGRVEDLRELNSSPKPQERPLAAVAAAKQEPLMEPLLPKSHFEVMQKEQHDKRNALVANAGLVGLRILLTAGFIYIACSSRQPNSLRIFSAVAIPATNVALTYLTKRINTLLSVIECLDQKREDIKPEVPPQATLSLKDYFLLKA